MSRIKHNNSLISNIAYRSPFTIHSSCTTFRSISTHCLCYLHQISYNNQYYNYRCYYFNPPDSSRRNLNSILFIPTPYWSSSSDVSTIVQPAELEVQPYFALLKHYTHNYSYSEKQLSNNDFAVTRRKHIGISI